MKYYFAVNVDLSFFKTESLSVGVQLRYDQNTKQHLVPMALDTMIVFDALDI